MTSAVRAHARKWGNSLGIRIPKEIVKKEGIKENQEVDFLLIKDSNKAFEKTFGIGKGKIKKTAQQLKDQIRKELYND